MPPRNGRLALSSDTRPLALPPRLQMNTRTQRRWVAPALFLALASVPLALTEVGAPAASQERVTDAEPLGFGYGRKDGYVYFEGLRIDRAGREDIAEFSRFIERDLTLCSDVDAASFVALSEPYTKDRNTVYYKWTSPGKFWVVELPDADVRSFEVLGFNLARDAFHVWWYGAVLPGLDPATVEVVKDGFAWKDARSVWYQHERIEGADPKKTFEHLGRGFYRDAARVYWGSQPLEGADARTFRSFGDDSPYGADANRVWSGPKRVDGPEAATFRAVHRSAFADARDAFEGPGKPLEGADPATFRKVVALDGYGTALLRDARYHYLYKPTYNIAYRLEPQGASLRVTRTIWSAGDHPHVRGRTSAVLTETGWTELATTTEGGRPTRRLRAHENRLLETYRESFEEAWDALRKGD